jgi:hypothetical protein
MKKCTNCETFKPTSEYYTNPKGYQYLYCNSCRSAKNKKYHEYNAEIAAEYYVDYYAKNSEDIKTKRLEKSDEYNAYASDYRKNNREAVNAYSNYYYHLHKNDT